MPVISYGGAIGKRSPCSLAMLVIRSHSSSARRLSHPRGNYSASRTSLRSRRVCLPGSRGRSGCSKRLIEERTYTARPHRACFTFLSKNTARTVTYAKRERSPYSRAGIKAVRTHSSAWVHSRWDSLRRSYPTSSAVGAKRTLALWTSGRRSKTPHSM